jgi:hypothetical protein
VERLAADPDLDIPGFDVDAFADPTTQKPAVLWFWNRTQTNAQVDQTLQDMHDAGFTETVIFRMDAEAFFSDAWFNRVQHVLETSQDLGMKVWLDNDSQFPSGAAGGLIVNGGTVGGTTYQPHPEMEFKTAVRSGNSVVRGGRSIDLPGLFGSSITVENGEVVADASVFPGITLLKAGAAWSDYTTTAHFTIGAGTAGFMVRSPDDKNGYLVDIRKAGSRRWRTQFTYEQPAPDRLRLNGTMDGHRLEVQLRQVNADTLRLLNSRFRWVRMHEQRQ